jgi:hypothetical protein
MRMMTIIRSFSFALLMAVTMVIAAPSFAQVAVGVAVTFAPPDLPVYDQPVCPGEDYIWVPGYWAWDGGDYYWVPGTWVLAPEPGFLWTPGYWGWGDGGYFFTAGYWGPVVGFYGGINYGFGYFGTGYEGGRWQGGHFFYNRAVNNVNVTVIHNTYNTTIRNTTVTRVSYNGGNGGISARPTPQEEAAAHETHVGPVAAQTQQVEAARSNQQLRASVNHGKPPVAATARPGEFSGQGTVAAREGGAVHTGAETGNAPENRPATNANAGANNAARIHPNDYPAPERPAAPNTGNAKLDQKYQQQQEKLFNQQAKERQQLQQKQDQDHQKMAKQQANDAKQQQLEQRHQQQTQQLMQKQTQRMQSMQQRQQPAHAAPPPAPRPEEPERH